MWRHLHAPNQSDRWDWMAVGLTNQYSTLHQQNSNPPTDQPGMICTKQNKTGTFSSPTPQYKDIAAATTAHPQLLPSARRDTQTDCLHCLLHHLPRSLLLLLLLDRLLPAGAPLLLLYPSRLRLRYCRLLLRALLRLRLRLYCLPLYLSCLLLLRLLYRLL